MKSLQARLMGMLSLMLAIALVFAGILIWNAQGENSLAERYAIKNKLAGHLNSAAAWQAIERGIGATFLGMKTPPSALRDKFEKLGVKGDEEVRLAVDSAKELIEAEEKSEDLQNNFTKWQQYYSDVKSLRSGVMGRSVAKKKWIGTATKNIRSEFMLRLVAFAPTTPREQVPFYNGVLRANIATLAEYAGLERAQIGGVIASGKPVPAPLASKLKQFRALVENASTQLLGVKSLKSTPPKLVNAIAAYEQEFLGGYQQLREQVYKASADGAPYPVNAPTWIGRATKAINTALAISNVIGELSTGAADQIEADAHNSKIYSVGLLIFSIVVFIFVFLFIKRSVVAPINKSIEVLGAGSSQITSASGQISSTSQSLAQGSTEQASSLEETSSALEQMASMTRQNADNANQATSLAKDSRQAAENGASLMGDMNVSMQAMNKSSEEISKIIKVIEEIAFQTNLLALNAAVEAARAGEHGKGFAVVAEEVRNLAQRSATAAKDTATLIEDSVDKVKGGGEMALKASGALDVIVDGIKKVNDLVAEIAAASTDQAQGVEQVNRAVSEMDKVTQQNAATAEESAAASEELSAQAESLNDVVGGLIELVSGVKGGGGAGITRKLVSATRTPPARKPAVVARRPAAQAAPKAPPAPPKTKAVSEDVFPMDDDFDEF